MRTYSCTRGPQTGATRAVSNWAPTVRRLATVLAFLSVFLFTVQVARADDPGEELFKTQCGACHTVGLGKLVGPDLRGVTERREQAWLLKFIKSSQTMVQAGDPIATQLFDEFNKTPMPDPPYSEEQIGQILVWLKKLDAEGGTFSLAAQAVFESTPENIALGRDLFQGTIRLENGGPTCVSCHDVKDDAVIGGGVLAKELTSAFSTVGGAGVQAILGKPPFPVMEQAYVDHPLTDVEIGALVVFLQDADANQAFQQPRDYGVKLFGSGVGGLVVLMGFYAAIWRRRKRVSVNDAIYARQVKSQ
jgi:mono/diheme cytochrome c family protein